MVERLQRVTPSARTEMDPIDSLCTGPIVNAMVDMCAGKDGAFVLRALFPACENIESIFGDICAVHFRNDAQNMNVMI